MNVYKVSFKYEDEGFTYVRAETPEEGKAIARDMLKDMPSVSGIILELIPVEDISEDFQEKGRMN